MDLCVEIASLVVFLLGVALAGSTMLWYLEPRRYRKIDHIQIDCSDQENDQLPPTEEWLRSIGFNHWDYSESNGVRAVSLARNGKVYLSYSELRKMFTWSMNYPADRVICDTRRKVRLICELCGVELKG